MVKKYTMIRLERSVHQKLIRLQGELLRNYGRRMSLSQLISALVDNYEKAGIKYYGFE